MLSTPVAVAPDPIELIGRTFNRTGSLQITALAPVLTGIELAPLVPSLEAFPNKQAWPIWLRRPLLRLTHADAALLRPLLLEVAVEPSMALQGYLDIGKDSLVER